MNTRGLVLSYLAKKTCATLEEIAESVKISKGNVKTVLSRLARERYITRRWIRVAGQRKRLYCINTSVLKEMKLE